MKKWITPIAWLLCISMLLSACRVKQGGTAAETTTVPGGLASPTTDAPANPETTPGDIPGAITTPVQTTLPATGPAETTPAPTQAPETTPAPTQPSGGSRPGGTGGFTGGSTGGTGSTTPEELTVPQVGSDTNPLAEYIRALPDAFSTVTVPAGGSISYRISGVGGTVLTLADPDATVTLDGTTYTAQNGVLTLPIPYGKGTVAVKLGNNGSENKSFDLEITAAPGGQSNPQVLNDLNTITTQLASGQTRHYYVYTAAESGKLSLNVDSVQPETTAVTVTMTGEGTTSTTDETGTWLEVVRGEEITICLTADPAGEATVNITSSFEASLGTQANPIPILSVDQPYVATVPGENTVYYSGYLHEMTMHMLGCEEVVLLIGDETVSLDEDGNIVYTFPAAEGVGRPMPIVFGLRNTCDTETSYTLTFTYPVGSLMNPAELILGDNTATIRPDNADGYNYAWTATQNGMLIISMQGDNWQYVVNNLTQGTYGEMMDASMDASVAETVLNISQGDEITLSVNGFDPQDPWALPGGTVSFRANVTDTPGSRNNPISIGDLSAPFVTTIPAETTYYYTGLLYDVDMEAYDAYGLELSFGPDDAYDEGGYLLFHFPAYEGVGRPQPITFCLSNATGEDATYTLQFIFPLGTAQNPDALILGENTANVAADNPDGYIYNWTATASGELTIALQGDGWSYTLSNLTAGTYGDIHTSGDEPVVATETIQVTEGDLVQLVVNTYDAESNANPAGSICVRASFVEPDLGTEANPEEVMGQFPIDTQKMLPGTSRYYDVYGCSGMIISTDATITVNGEAYDGSVLNVGRGEAVRLVVINDTHASNRFLIRFEFPKGHPENPDKLSLGSNRATLDAGNENGYTYTWTAAADGTLVVVMGSGSWQYVLSNDTAGYTGELMDSSVPAAAISKLEVKAGDKVSLNVNSFDPAEPWSYPGGDVRFTASFYETEMAVETLADGVRSGKEVEISSGDLAKGGKAYLVISAVVDTASGNAVPYMMNSTDADGSQLLVISTGTQTQWTITQENGAELEVTYAVIYVYEPVSAEPGETQPGATDPEVTDPEPTEPETTDPEVTDPEPTEPETTDPEVTDPEPTEPETTDPEVTDPEPTEPETTDPEVTDPEPTGPETPPAE